MDGKVCLIYKTLTIYTFKFSMYIVSLEEEQILPIICISK
jgi:hypothetical protein